MLAGSASGAGNDARHANRLIQMHRSMLTIRAAEEKAGRLFADGEIPGFIHLSIGQEAVPVGVASALRREDTVSSNHRGHGHALAKGMSLEAFFLELMGKAEGVCRGHGGSIHVADLSIGMLGANGIVGGGLALAVGSAMAHQVKRNGCVAVSFFGDGALAEGAFHECVNLATLWRLPVLFACENNGWAEFTPSSEQIAFDLGRFAAAFNLPFTRVDGNDVEAVAAAAEAAVSAMRDDPHPRMLELVTSRARGHFEGDPQKYRADAAKSLQPASDPLARSRARLVSSGHREADLDALADAARRSVDEAVARARSGSEASIESAMAMVYTVTQVLP